MEGADIDILHVPLTHRALPHTFPLLPHTCSAWHFFNAAMIASTLSSPVSCPRKLSSWRLGSDSICSVSLATLTV